MDFLRVICPTPKKLSYDCNIRHNPRGIFTQAIAYMGIVSKTDLESTSLPAGFTWLLFQLLTLLKILSLIYISAAFLECPIMKGIPKYFPSSELLLKPKMSLHSNLLVVVVFELNKIDDFYVFTNCPEAFPYDSSTSFTVSLSSLTALQNIRESSTKSRCDIVGPPLDIVAPLKPPCPSLLFNKLDNPSAH